MTYQNCCVCPECLARAAKHGENEAFCACETPSETDQTCWKCGHTVQNKAA